MTLTDLRDGLLAVGVPVYHYQAREESGNYIVWAEDGQAGAGHGDGIMLAQMITGTVDYFTRMEFDPVFGKVQDTLNRLPFAWRLESVQYETDSGYIHYEWIWEGAFSVGENNNS